MMQLLSDSGGPKVGHRALGLTPDLASAARFVQRNMMRI